MDDHHYLIRGGLEGRQRLRVLGRVMRPTTLPALTLENIKATAIRHGVATEEEFDGLVDHLYTLAADPLTYVANPRMVQVFGERT